MQKTEEGVVEAAAGEAAAAAEIGTVSAPGLAEIAELLAQIRADAGAQRVYAKKRLRMMRVCALALAGIFLAVALTLAVLLPRVNTILGEADTVLGNLNTVSTTLAAVDYTAMLDNVDRLVQQSEASITQALTDVQRALQVVEAIDIEKLNQSITDLQNIVAPLSRLFGNPAA